MHASIIRSTVVAEIFFWSIGLAQAFEEPMPSPLIQNQCQVRNILPQVDQAYREILEKSFFDSTLPYLNYSGNPLSPKEKKDFIPLLPSSLELFQTYSSSTEVGLLQQLIQRLTPDIRIDLIPSSLPDRYRDLGAPNLDNVAAVAACTDGYLLIDPGMNLSHVVPIYPNQPSVAYSNGSEKWTLALQSEKKQIQVLISRGTEKTPQGQTRQTSYEYRYFLQKISNPDEAVIHPHFVSTTNALIFKYSLPEKHFFRMLVDFNLKEVSFKKETREGQETILLKTSFEEISSNFNFYRENILQLSELQDFGIPLETLLARIASILKI